MSRRGGIPRFAVVGAGAVGSALAMALSRRGFKLRALVTASSRTAHRLKRRFPKIPTGASLSVLPDDVDLLVIAVPEQQLSSVALALAHRFGTALKGKRVFHLSGSISSDVLLPVEKKGAVVFSLHPIQAFPADASIDDRASLLRGISYGFEGDRRAERIARRVVRLLGGRFVRVPKEGKIAYHLACVFASNFIMALHESARQLTGAVGGSLRTEDLHPLMESALRYVMRSGAARVMTGPVVRKSGETLRRHLQYLDNSEKQFAAVYRALSSVIVDAMRRRHRLTARDAADLTAILGGNSRRIRRTNSGGANH